MGEIGQGSCGPQAQRQGQLPPLVGLLASSPVSPWRAGPMWVIREKPRVMGSVRSIPPSCARKCVRAVHRTSYLDYPMARRGKRSRNATGRTRTTEETATFSNEIPTAAVFAVVGSLLLVETYLEAENSVSAACGACLVHEEWWRGLISLAEKSSGCGFGGEQKMFALRCFVVDLKGARSPLR